MIKIASFNVENLYARPKAFNEGNALFNTATCRATDSEVRRTQPAPEVGSQQSATVLS